MLKSLSRFTSSFAALLIDPNTEPDLDARFEDIRTAMAFELLQADQSEDCSFVWAGIARAGDVHTLWYLRSDLLRVLAENLGEPLARAQVDRITEMFRGRVPAQMMAAVGRASGPRSRAA